MPTPQTLREIVLRIEAAAGDAGYASDGGDMRREALAESALAWAEYDKAEEALIESARAQGRAEALAELRTSLLYAAGTLDLVAEALRRMAGKEDA